MMRSMYTSASGMKAQEMNVNVIANNLANVNTPGFKRSAIQFQDLFYIYLNTPGSETAKGVLSPTGLDLGTGVRAESTSRVFVPGFPEETGRELDVAIDGRGFFEVQLPDGTQAYTRDGSFRLDASGNLVTARGYLLQGGITTPSETIALCIARDGTVSATGPGGRSTSVGKMQLAMFPNPSGLKALGGNLYQKTDAAGEETVAAPGREGRGELLQYFLEKSNVEVVHELVNLIVAQRAYEMNSRSIKAGDDMLAIVGRMAR